MAALSEFVPLRNESVDTIRARIDANVNLGLAPGDDRWQDTIPGGWFFDHTQAFALEAEGLWDYASLELPASFFLTFSWGIYLDYWGEMLAVPRNPPVSATGEVELANATANDIGAAAGTNVAVPAPDPTGTPLIFTLDATVNVPAGGSVFVAITAEETGPQYNVSAAAITQVTSPGEVGGLTVTNADPVSGGADEELDEPYKARLLLEFSGARGGGTIDDYIAETLRNFPSVGSVAVQPTWAGPGTVRLVISDQDHQALSGAVVAAVQDYWDVEAPIDAAVTVTSVTVVETAIHADLELFPGYSLDGASGTTAVEEALVAALQQYFHTLPAGRDVLHNRVIATLLAVDGVYDVTGLTIDGLAGDKAVADTDSAQLDMTPPPTFTAVYPPSM